MKTLTQAILDLRHAADRLGLALRVKPATKPKPRPVRKKKAKKAKKAKQYVIYFGGRGPDRPIVLPPTDDGWRACYYDGHRAHLWNTKTSATATPNRPKSAYEVKHRERCRWHGGSPNRRR